MWKTARFGRGLGFEMMIKIVSLFLIAMVALGLFGGFRKLGAKKTPPKRPNPLPKPALCSECGAPVAGTKPCPCQMPPAG